MTTILDLIADGVPAERIDEIVASSEGGCTDHGVVSGADSEVIGADELADLDADE